MAPVVGRLACPLDRQVYGVEMQFAWIRRRPRAAGEPLEMLAAKPTLACARRRHFVQTG
jgi:hypothetical protein